MTERGIQHNSGHLDHASTNITEARSPGEQVTVLDTLNSGLTPCEVKAELISHHGGSADARRAIRQARPALSAIDRAAAEADIAMIATEGARTVSERGEKR